MKKKTSLVILSSVLFAGILAFGATLTWYNSQAFMQTDDSPIEGSVIDKYYDSGTGTQADPYIIKLPRHLYNLAWLQYLGFYNKSDGTSDDHQFYFKLADNIDMGSIGAIPPIGTETNPFVGNFDGQGYVVSNVTISNSFDDYRYHPSVMDDNQGVGTWNNTDHLQPHVLGFFGVVGYPSNTANKPTVYSSSVNEFKNTGLVGTNVKTVLNDCLVGIAAGCAYDTTPNDANSIIKNVVVDDSKLTLPNTATTAYSGTSSLTTNVSDFTLVGYTNVKGNAVKASKTTYGINTDTNITFSASEEGNVAGWGGSIDMKEMYDNLDDIWKSFEKNGRNDGGTIPAIQYYATKDVYYDYDGTLLTNKTEVDDLTAHRVPYREGTVFPTGNTTNYHSYYNHTQEDSSDNKTTASYGFIIEEDTTNEENFMCLTGNKEVTISGGQAVTTHYYDSYYGQKISVTISGNTYYLKTNGTNDVTATTNVDEASLWSVSGTTIYTAIDEVQYFLNRSGTTTVTLGTSSTTSWNYDSTYKGYYTTYNSKNYYLNCTTTDWNLTTIVAAHILLSDGNGHYITHPSGTSNGNAGSSTDSTSETTWWLQNGSYYKSYSSSTARNLRSYYSTNIGNNTTSNQNMYVSNSTTRATYLNGGYLYTTYSSGGRTHYVYAYYNGSTWRETIATGTANPPANRTPITVDNIPETLSDGASNISLSSVSSTPTYIARQRTDNEDIKVEVNHTFFPLRQEETKPGVPADTNTGYVVSGANYWDDPYGDIRVSKYARVYTTGSGWNQQTEYRLETACFNNGSLIDVKTINADGSTVSVNTSDFKKYDAAKSSMETVLTNDNNIYGLHFMNADIHYGGTNPVIAEKAIVNGTTHYDYELPTDCVDFSLKEKGFINFFAGTYYPSNNCFFSLHEVFRTGSTIDDVKEIIEIYEDPSDTSDVKSYVYKYSNGKYSLPFTHANGEKVKLDGTAYPGNSEQNSKPSAYSKLAFATSRIKNNSLTDNYAYYFEIPMHEGEYCLGSVSGYNGAYLMYLDIAANASKANRTVMYQKFAITKTTYNYPVGVSLGSLSVSYATGVQVITSDIDSSDSACMLIKASATGVFEMNRSANDVALTRAQSANAPPIYASDNLVVHDSGSATELTLQALTTSNEIIKQMTYYDYMVISDSTVVTTVIDKSTDGGSTFTRSYIKQETYGGTDLTKAPKSTYIYDGTTDQRSSMKIYNHSDNGRRYNTADLINVSTFAISNDKLNTDSILVFKLFQNGNDEYEDSTAVVVSLDTSMNSYGTFFKYNGIAITISSITDGQYTIKVTDYSSTFTLKTYNIGSNNPSTPTQTTATVVITINGTTITGVNQVLPE